MIDNRKQGKVIMLNPSPAERTRELARNLQYI